MNTRRHFTIIHAGDDKDLNNDSKSSNQNVIMNLRLSIEMTAFSNWLSLKTEGGIEIACIVQTFESVFHIIIFRYKCNPQVKKIKWGFGL